MPIASSPIDRDSAGAAAQRDAGSSPLIRLRRLQARGLLAKPANLSVAKPAHKGPIMSQEADKCRFYLKRSGKRG